MYNSCVRPVRRNSWKSWPWSAWHPNHCMSDAYKSHYRNGSPILSHSWPQPCFRALHLFTRRPPHPTGPPGPLPPGMTPAAAAALMSAAAEGQRPIPHHSGHHPRHSPPAAVSLPTPPSHSSRDMMTNERCPSQRRSPVTLMGQAFPGNTPPSASRRVSSPVPVGNLSSASAGTASSRSSPSPTLGKEQRNCSSGGGGGGGCSSDISQIVLSIAQHQV